jgi:hypothetical protein
MYPFAYSFRRGLAALAAGLVLSALSIRPAFAAPYDYTDSWYVPTESGWGALFTQADNFLFVAIFIHGQDNSPTWYTANLTWDGTKFTGPLYLNRGTYFALPWNPMDQSQQQVGSASFTPSAQNNYQGTLSYTVTGVASVTKAVTRLPSPLIPLGANYVGGQSGTYSGCSAGPYQDFFNLVVTQTGTNISMAFTYPSHSPALTCTLSGTSIQNGLIYRIPTARYQCSDGVDTTASVTNLRATPLGIEGQFDAAPPMGGGCREIATFGGTLN